MALKERLSAIKTDDLADLSEIIDEVSKLESDLETANNVISEKDKKISELQETSNRLYAKLVLNDTGKVEEKEETWEDMEGDEALEAFMNTKEGKELWQ